MRCLDKVKISNLGYQGYLGVSSANHDATLTTLNVNRIQLWNLAPTHNYREKQTTEEYKEPLSDPSQLSRDAIDLLGIHMESDERDYLRNNLATLSLEDSESETIYKMYESAKHINSRISNLQKQEESFYNVVKKYSGLHEIISDFGIVSEHLDGDAKFIEMIEQQVQQLHTLLSDSITTGVSS